MKKEVFIPSKKGIGCICAFMNIIFILMIIVNIVSFKESYSNAKKLNGQISAIVVLVFLTTTILLILCWIAVNYILLTISANRKYIKDLSLLLNKTGIIAKGVKAVKNDAEHFDSYEFNDLTSYEVSYCSCGMQLFEEDDVCPNCGKKVNKK